MSKFSDHYKMWCKFVREVLLAEEIKDALEETRFDFQKGNYTRENDFRLIADILKHQKGFNSKADLDITSLVKKGVFKDEKYKEWINRNEDLINILCGKQGNGNAHGNDREGVLCGVFEDFLNNFDINTDIRNKYMQNYMSSNINTIENIKSKDNIKVANRVPTTSEKLWNRYSARDFCCNHGYRISKNFNYASENVIGNVYWVNSDLDWVEQDWDIILDYADEGCFKILHIPANKFTVDDFRIKTNKQGSKLDLAIDKHSFIDKYSEVNFRGLLAKIIKY